MNKKSLIVIAVLMAVLIGGSVFLYKKLTPQVDQNNFMTATDSEGTVENDSVTDDKKENENNSENQLVKVQDFTVYDIDGNEAKLSDYTGKPVIVNFWASWCGPCKMEMPDFEEKYKEYGDEIQFMMINVTDGDRETVEKAKAHIDENGYTFPVFYDTQLNASAAYYVYSLPSTYFIDAEGNGIAYATGAINAQAIQQGIDMIYTP